AGAEAETIDRPGDLRRQRLEDDTFILLFVGLGRRRNGRTHFDVCRSWHGFMHLVSREPQPMCPLEGGDWVRVVSIGSRGRSAMVSLILRGLSLLSAASGANSCGTSRGSG